MDDFKDKITELIPHLRRYAFAMINHKESADDLVQDCLERALRKKSLWDNSRPIKPWLFTILHNIFANEARRFNRTPVLLSLNELDDIRDTSNATDITLTELYQSLELLSEDHRGVILLVAVEELSYKETANILDIPIGTVMSRLTRARKQLRKEMNKHSSPCVRVIK